MYRWCTKACSHFNLYWYDQTGYWRTEHWSEKTEVRWKRSFKSATGKLVHIHIIGETLSQSIYKTPRCKFGESCTNVWGNSVPVSPQVKCPQLLAPFELKTDSKSCAERLEDAIKELQESLRKQTEVLYKILQIMKENSKRPKVHICWY